MERTEGKRGLYRQRGVEIDEEKQESGREKDTICTCFSQYFLLVFVWAVSLLSIRYDGDKILRFINRSFTSYFTRSTPSVVSEANNPSHTFASTNCPDHQTWTHKIDFCLKESANIWSFSIIFHFSITSFHIFHIMSLLLPVPSLISLSPSLFLFRATAGSRHTLSQSLSPAPKTRHMRGRKILVFAACHWKIKCLSYPQSLIQLKFPLLSLWNPVWGAFFMEWRAVVGCIGNR